MKLGVIPSIRLKTGSIMLEKFTKICLCYFNDMKYDIMPPINTLLNNICERESLFLLAEVILDK